MTRSFRYIDSTEDTQAKQIVIMATIESNVLLPGSGVDVSMTIGGQAKNYRFVPASDANPSGDRLASATAMFSARLSSRTVDCTISVKGSNPSRILSPTMLIFRGSGSFSQL
ncbi:hypothetical protein [Buttiauxella gaviniae]|uniref:hypothetical protein n=1 Tax=Buttiauxella gaviniae TaxID=82990 RepID=UPI0012EE60B2|nr:hypothetical protein [Buttiauxella gaviniae]